MGISRFPSWDQELLVVSRSGRDLLIQVVGSFSVRLEHDPAVVRRPDRENAVGRLEREAGRNAPGEIVDPDVRLAGLRVSDVHGDTAAIAGDPRPQVVGRRPQDVELLAGAIQPGELRDAPDDAGLVGESSVVRRREHAKPEASEVLHLLTHRKGLAGEPKAFRIERLSKKSSLVQRRECDRWPLRERRARRPRWN